MKVLLSPLILVLHMFLDSTPIYHFNQESADDWYLVNDVVMGGRSNGHFQLSEQGHGIFSGQVSLENNGGFSSIRHDLKTQAIDPKGSIVIRLKGDGKRYQFRIKANKDDYYSYLHYFETSGEWEEIKLDLADFYPSFRGRKLAKPNFDQGQIEQISFLIANYRAETFRLEIDRISLVNN
jgi:hypothetical protein